MKWQESNAIITGASRGIGRAAAIMASKRGAKVGLIARTQSDLETVLKECGGRGAIATADVTSRSELEAAIKQIEQQMGPCDILVNNAGAGAFGSFIDTSIEAYEEMIRVNYFSTLYAMKAVLPGMLQRRRGHIVNVASIAGRIGAPLESAYSGSKFAVAGMSEAVAIELASKGIGLSIVNPGPVKTNFFQARGAPYERKSPKPVEAEVVAKRIIDAVEKNKLDSYIPRWLGAAVLARVSMPSMYKNGTRRSFKGQL
ncbi:MAG: SDR family NAD(P)-dependent oxidoreductase [Actinomycetota bacterium]